MARNFHEITYFTQLIDTFAQCVQMRCGYLYEIHKEALRQVNDTYTKSEKKRKDPTIIMPAFVAVYLT